MKLYVQWDAVVRDLDFSQNVLLSSEINNEDWTHNQPINDIFVVHVIINCSQPHPSM